MTATSPSPTVIAPLDYQTWIWQGHEIRYVVAGQGHPLILLHGFGASAGHWRKNIPALTQAGYQVYAIDLLGFGKSAKPAIAYSLDLWQDLLVEFCQTQVQQPATLMGNSIGALLTLMMLAHHPHLCQRGILLNAAGGLNHRPEELNLPLRWVMGTFTQLVQSRWIGPFLFERIRQKPRIRETLKQVYRDHSAVTDELVELLYEPSCDPGAQQVFAAILSGPPGPRPAELLPQIQQPLLVLWGEADPWTPIQGATLYQELADTRPDVTFVAIPNAGHCPHDECPDTVNRLVVDWLAQPTRTEGE